MRPRKRIAGRALGSLSEGGGWRGSVSRFCRGRGCSRCAGFYTASGRGNGKVTELELVACGVLIYGSCLFVAIKVVAGWAVFRLALE